MEKELKHNRGGILFIIEATAEYLISILVAGSYLATLTSSIGISDAVTGIISSFISLGCLFQLLSLFYTKSGIKTFLFILSLINQLLFLTLYIIPFFNIPGTVKTIVFSVVILSAYIIYYFAHPKKITWFTSFIPESQRGSFTANKEITSLVIGIVFQFAAAKVLDHYKLSGRLNTAFIIVAAVIVVLTIIHSASILLAPEKEIETHKKISIVDAVKNVVKNKNVLKIFLVCIAYYAATYISTPYHAVYQLNDLGFSLTTVSILTIIGNMSRIVFSRFWGKLADKKSFITMFKWALAVLGVANAAYIFATPKTALITVTLYYIFHGIAMGGINNAITNIIFVYAAPSERSDSLAVCQAVSGTVGFLSTLLISPFIAFMQSRGNTLFGITIYAQQIISIISFLMITAIIIFIKFSMEEKNNGIQSKN